MSAEFPGATEFLAGTRTAASIGGVPPWGWAIPPERTVIDRDLLSYDEIWAAAGTPSSVFPLSP